MTGPTTAVGAGVAVAGLAYCVRRAELHGDDGRLPLAGLAGAFFLVGDTPFIPIGVGTQGHLLGGTLAVALLGPWLGALTIAVVTIVQALVQGDGGITVLGLNIVNAALVPAFVGWPILRGLQRLIRRRQGKDTAGGLAAACAAAAYVNVLLAALLFVTEFHLGHKGSIDIEPVVGGTVGVYAFVGVLEAVLTAGIVRALLARRPDLVMIAPPALRRPRRRPRPRPATAIASVPPPPGTAPRVPPPPGTEPRRPASSAGDPRTPPAGAAPQRPVPAADAPSGPTSGTEAATSPSAGAAARVPPPPGCEPQPRPLDPDAPGGPA
nr:energy-coupling factor ABC transporter permease [Patulibacter sp. SYSU D01012]